MKKYRRSPDKTPVANKKSREIPKGVPDFLFEYCF